LGAFTFGQVRQLDAVAARLLPVLVGQAPILPDAGHVCDLDLDDTVKATHGYQKQGAGYGYSGVKGLNALIATISTPTSRPLIVAIRLRRGGTNSARGAARIVATPGHDAGLRRFGAGDRARRQRLLRPGRHRRGPPRRGEVLHHRPDEPPLSAGPSPASRSRPGWRSATRTRSGMTSSSGSSPTRRSPRSRTPAFTSRRTSEQVTGRLIVRRVVRLNPASVPAGQGELFTTYRYHAVFTDTTLPMLEAEKTHRAHAVIEQVHADMRDGPLAHLPSASFSANGAWLVLAAIAFNLTRAAGAIASAFHAKATTATIRRHLIAVPARLARSARRLALHLPQHWPWQSAWQALFTATCGPPTPATT